MVLFWWGFVVWFGVMLILWKMPRRAALWWLGHDVWLDVIVSVLALIVHWGTFSGVMAATVAGLLMSISTSAGKRWFGYISGGVYHRGFIELKLPPVRAKRAWFKRRMEA